MRWTQPQIASHDEFGGHYARSPDSPVYENTLLPLCSTSCTNLPFLYFEVLAAVFWQVLA